MDSPKLSHRAREVLRDPGSLLFVSTVSVWEIVTKTRTGKLSLSEDPARLVPDEMAANGFRSLPITLEHALHLQNVPIVPGHRDPFDLMLVAQSQVEALPVLTADPAFRGYAVEIVW